MDNPDVLAASVPLAPLAIDHPCIKCGYSLRGLLPTALCPECGTLIERSLRGDMLVYSDPSYIDTLLKGVRMIVGSILLIVVVTVAVVALAIAKLMTGAAQLMPYAQVAVWCLFLFGWWKLTSPDPGQLSTNKGESPRRIARMSLLIVAAVSVVGLPLRFAFPGIGPVMWVLTIANYLAMATGFNSGMLYIRWLAPRIPNMKASRRARTLMIMIGFLLAMYLGLFVAGIMATSTTVAGKPVPAIAFLGIVSGLSGLLILVSLIMYYNLFAWLRKDLLAIQAQQRLTDPAAP